MIRFAVQCILLLMASHVYGDARSFAKELRVIQKEETTKTLRNMGFSQEKIDCHLRELDKIPEEALINMVAYHNKYQRLPDSWRTQMESIGQRCEGAPNPGKVKLSEKEARLLETDELRQLARKNQFSSQVTRCLILESDATPGRQVIDDVEYRIKNGNPSVNNLRRIERIAQRCGNL